MVNVHLSERNVDFHRELNTVNVLCDLDVANRVSKEILNSAVLSACM